MTATEKAEPSWFDEAPAALVDVDVPRGNGTGPHEGIAEEVLDELEREAETADASPDAPGATGRWRHYSQEEKARILGDVAELHRERARRAAELGYGSWEEFLDATSIRSLVHSREADVPSARMNAEPPRLLPFRTAADLVGDEGVPVPWILRGFVGKGLITEVDGRPKASGKTTFILEIVAASVVGRRFLGEASQRGPVVFLSEQSTSSLRPALARAGLADREDLVVLLWAEARGVTWPDVVAAAVAECRRIGAEMLAVDTLPQWAGIRGDAENNAGAALEAVEPLQVAAARDGLAVVIARHDRKGGGEVGDSGRGSSAFTGAVDIVLQLRRRPNAPRPTIRDLLALSRFVETPDELVIELTPAGYVILGTAEAIALEEAKAAVLSSLAASPTPLPVKPDLIERTGTPERTVRDALAILLESGQVTRSGTGRKGSPYLHAIASPDSGIHSRGPLKGGPSARNDSEDDPLP